VNETSADSSGGDIHGLNDSPSEQRALPAPAESQKALPAPPKKRSHWLWWVLGLVCLGVVGFLIVRGRKDGKNAATTDETVQPTINVASVYRGDIGQYVEALGTVTPIATVNVYTQLTGRVIGVHYAEGQMVRRGDPLIDIDPKPYQAQLLEAEGTLDHDRGVLAEAQIDLARYKDASANNAISRQTFEDQQQTVLQDQGTVKNDQGQVQYAQVQLSYCHLVSPITGRMGLRLVDVGNTVFSGSSNALAVITQLQPITVVFDVAEDNLSKLHREIEHRTALRVDAYDRAQVDKIATGKLLTLDNQIDTTTGTVRFRGQFDNATLSLYPNQFVNTRLLVDTIRNATLTPSAAIQHNGVNAFVYRIVNNSAKPQAVRELATEGEVTAVEGLQPGDFVAVTGFDKLEDGTKINAQRTPQPKGEGAH
jgi:multidrug efflux system membrane fusion protein